MAGETGERERELLLVIDVVGKGRRRKTDR